MIQRLTQRLARFRADQRGAVMVEYALLLAGFVLVMMKVFNVLLDILLLLFEMIVFSLNMPFI